MGSNRIADVDALRANYNRLVTAQGLGKALNLSFTVIPALADISSIVPSMQIVVRSRMKLLQQALSPAEWLRVQQALAPAAVGTLAVETFVGFTRKVEALPSALHHAINTGKAGREQQKQRCAAYSYWTGSKAQYDQSKQPVANFSGQNLTVTELDAYAPAKKSIVWEPSCELDRTLSREEVRAYHDAWHDEYGRAPRQQHVRGSTTQEVRGTLPYYRASAIEHAVTVVVAAAGVDATAAAAAGAAAAAAAAIAAATPAPVAAASIPAAVPARQRDCQGPAGMGVSDDGTVSPAVSQQPEQEEQQNDVQPSRSPITTLQLGEEQQQTQQPIPPDEPRRSLRRAVAQRNAISNCGIVPAATHTNRTQGRNQRQQPAQVISTAAAAAAAADWRPAKAPASDTARTRSRKAGLSGRPAGGTATGGISTRIRTDRLFGAASQDIDAGGDSSSSSSSSDSDDENAGHQQQRNRKHHSFTGRLLPLPDTPVIASVSLKYKQGAIVCLRIDPAAASATGIELAQLREDVTTVVRAGSEQFSTESVLAVRLEELEDQFMVFGATAEAEQIAADRIVRQVAAQIYFDVVSGCRIFEISQDEYDDLMERAGTHNG